MTRPALLVGLALTLALSACDSAAPPDAAPPVLADAKPAADPIPNGVYVLGNHPSTGRQWGMILTFVAGPQYTFDFEAEGADMRMVLNQSTVHLRGLALAYKRVGGTRQVGDLWRIDFTYHRNITSATDDPAIEQGGWVDVRVGDPHPANRGTLTNTATGETVPLVTKAFHGYTFQLGDEDGSGHRLDGHDVSDYDTDYDPGHSGDDDEENTPASGWGWVTIGDDEEPSPRPIEQPSDFLFILKGRTGGSPNG